MATQNVVYGTRAALAITLTSLANGAYRESTEVDNSSTLADDVVIAGTITAGTTPTLGNTISIYVSGSDGTTARPGNLTGTDSTITPAGEQTQFVLAAVIPVDATTGHVYEFYIGSLAALFGGIVPKKWSLIVLNSSAVALNAAGNTNQIFQTPITFTVA